MEIDYANNAMMPNQALQPRWLFCGPFLWPMRLEWLASKAFGDFAETLSLTESVTVPAGTFDHCLKSQETTPLETDLLEYKFYAPGVGNDLTVDART